MDYMDSLTNYLESLANYACQNHSQTAYNLSLIAYFSHAALTQKRILSGSRAFI